MSFILDALKKSEHERQRQSMPGLVESTMLRPKPRLPVWAIALCGLLAVNLLVLLFLLLRGWMAPSPGLAATAQHKPRSAAAIEPAQSDAAGDDGDAARDAARDAVPDTARDTVRAEAPAAADKHFSPLDAAPTYAPEVPVTPATAPSVSQRSATPAAAPPEAPIERNARRHDPVLNEDNYKPNEDEVLPSINEMNLTGAQALPELHLDVHVFATRAQDRFVFINMRKYHEGATMQEGPAIERIRRDGVILNYQGLRFLLPRQ
jgi:general secretion pathway protein B